DDIEESSEITLMTLHSAKGLEYPVVLIIGVEKNIFPLIRQDSTEEGVEEERRLAYVGSTRAERKLFLLNASSRLLYGRRQYNPTSPFIEEVDEAVIEIERKEDLPTYMTGDYSRPFKRKTTLTPTQKKKNYATKSTMTSKRKQNVGSGAETYERAIGDNT